MAIHVLINKEGVRDIVFVAQNSQESKDLISLYHHIESEVRAFEDLINEKLDLEESADLENGSEQG